MTITYKTIIYPALGKISGKLLSDVHDFSAEFNKAVVAYLTHEGIQDVQFFTLPGIKATEKMIKKARLDGGHNPLTVRGGTNTSGDLVVSVEGILPPAKSGGKPVKYEVSGVMRKGFAAAVKTHKTETSMVVNLEKAKHDSVGDGTINKAVVNQATRYGVTAPQTVETVDLGGLTTGTVILAAHGGAVAVSGTVLGTSLGRKTPQEIVDLLTKNTDKAKRLSKKFSGAVMLSGCYTASGSGKVPYDPVAMTGYNYDTFAGEVLRLLRAAGYKKASVRGFPGPKITKDDGSTKTLHGMKATNEAREALTEQIRVLKEKMEEIKRAHPGDLLGAQNDPRYKELRKQAKRIKKEKKDVLELDEHGAAATIDDLIATMGNTGK